MGSINSKEKLKQCTPEDIANHVTNMGEKYTCYAATIKRTGIDGCFLASASPQTLQETLDRLEVTERLHRRKFERVLYKISVLQPQEQEEWDTVCLTEESIASWSDSSKSLLESEKNLNSSTAMQRASTGSIGRRRRGHRKTPSDVPVEMVMECTLAARGMDQITPGSNHKLVDGVMQAVIAAQALERENLQQDFLELELKRKLDSPLESPPDDGMVAIVLTDVEHSTALWEHNPKAMKEALSLHDTLVRQIRETNHGYEIDTEGDAFFLAFSEPCDALAFALDLQAALYKATWSDEILATQWACDDGERRGLRVRVSVHVGPVETIKNPVTGRTEYHGEGMEVAQEVEKMTRGGQILTTFDTWNAAFHVADVKLGSPIVSEFNLPLVLNEKDMDGSVHSQSYKRMVELKPASMKRLSEASAKNVRQKRRGSLSHLPMRHRSHMFEEGMDTLPIRA